MSVRNSSVSRRSVLTAGLGLAGAGLLAGPPSLASATTNPTAPQEFIAAFPTARFSRYYWMYPSGVTQGVDYGLVRDPAGSRRTVAFFDNRRGLHLPGTMSRSAAETPRLVRPVGPGNPSDEYWFAASAYLPTPPKGVSDGDWFALATPAFGPPYNGTSPLSLGLRPKSSDEVRLVLGGDHRMLGLDFGMPTNTWCRVLINFKFAYDGWARMWVGTGLASTSWQQVPILGRSRCALPTMGVGVNDACATDPHAVANSSRIGAYGWPSRVYFGHHALTRSYVSALRAMR